MPAGLGSPRKVLRTFQRTMDELQFKGEESTTLLSCLDLKDGTQRWKEGRHGHGQGLLVGDRFVLMAETGELLLLQPTPDGPNELGRFRVFGDKTWNPIALSGDLLLARNDREAALLRLPRTP